MQVEYLKAETNLGWRNFRTQCTGLSLRSEKIEQEGEEEKDLYVS